MEIVREAMTPEGTIDLRRYRQAKLRSMLLGTSEERQQAISIIIQRTRALRSRVWRRKGLGRGAVAGNHL